MTGHSNFIDPITLGFTAIDGVGANDPSISDDGRWVAFVHRGFLDESDSNEVTDVYLADRASGAVTRITAGDGLAEMVAPNSAMGNGGTVGYTKISDDGRYVAFSTWSGGLLETDPDKRSFIYDRIDGEVVGIVNEHAKFISFLGDGTLIAQTQATNVIFSVDPETGATTQLLTTPMVGGDPSNPDASADGRVIVFDRAAYYGSANHYEAYSYDMTTGTLEKIGTAPDGSVFAGDSHAPSISDSGRYVVFHSADETIAPGDDDGLTDVFLYDRKTGSTIRVSENAAGEGGNDDSVQPHISPNGRYVVYVSGATNLTADSPGGDSIFLYDRVRDETRRVDIHHEGLDDGFSQYPMVTSGGLVVFNSMRTLVPDDTDNILDVYVADGRFSNARDRVRLEDWGETVTSGGGRDRVEGGGGNDHIDGGRGLDMLLGRGGRDRLQGGDHGDRLAGNRGNDRLEGNGGDDVLLGGFGKDRLFGGKGADTIKGGIGDDRLSGGNGTDKLVGGAGADVFQFTKGVNRVLDFDAAERDRVDLRGVAEDFTDLMASHARQVRDNVVISDESGNRLLLLDTAIETLEADDFMF